MAVYDPSSGVFPSEGEEYGQRPFGGRSGVGGNGVGKSGKGGKGGGPGRPGVTESGGSLDVVGSIPGLDVPTGEMVILREGDAQFRAIMDRFEGVDRKRSPTEIGELQATTIKNGLTDEQTLRKRSASSNVSASTTEACVGVHEVAGIRELTLQACDDSTQWTESDVTNFSRATDTAIKAEGTASLKMTTTGAGANGDTITHDLGLTKDLSKFDYIEVLLKGADAGSDGIYFGVSEDGTTYTETSLFSGEVTSASVPIPLVGLSAAAAAASGNLSVTPPTTIDDDILIAAVTTSDNVACTFPGAGGGTDGWTVYQEVNNGANLRATLAWARANGAASAFTITHAAGDAIIAKCAVYRGCKASGTPINVSGMTANASSATVTAASVTTTVANAMLVFTAHSGDDVTTSAQVFATAGTPVEQFDDTTALGLDAAISGAELIQAAAGATGAATGTLSGAIENVGAITALIPAGVTPWQTIRLDISALAATARDGIRYLRFRAANGATARVWWADIIRAVRRVSHRLRTVRTVGTSTGGVRDNPATVTLRVDSDESGAWVSQGVLNNILGNMKMRAVDWFGTTYLAFGQGGMFKYENGRLLSWEEAPPSLFIAQHYEKIFLLSQTFEPHGLMHSDVNTTSTFRTSTSPSGGKGGLFYVGRRYPYLPTGMRSAYGQLFVWTEGDCWILSGTNNQSWTLFRAHPGAGTLSSESIAVGDNQIFWHDGMSDRVLMWRGGGVVDIGVPIRADLAAIPTARKPWTGGAFDGRYYYLSYTRSGQTVNDRTWVFDSSLLRWHGPWEGDWVGFTGGYLGGDGLVYLGTEANGVRKYADGVAGTEGTLGFTWKSSALNFRIPQWTKRIRRFRMKLQDATAGQVFTLNFYKDLATSAVRSYTLTAAGGKTEVVSTGVDNDVLGDVIEAELVESSANAVKINQILFDAYAIRELR